MAIDPDTVAHESAHAAAGVLTGLTVTAVDCIGDHKTFAGQIKHIKSDDWRAVAKTLMVADLPPGFPPNASRHGQTASAYNDVSHLLQLIRERNIDEMTYFALKVEAQELAESPGYKSLKARIEDALIGSDGLLDEEAIDSVVRRWEWDNGGG